MRIVVTHHLNLLDLDPRVPAAPATCSANYTQPQATFPKSPRSRGIAVLLPGGSDNFDHAPAKPEPPSSKSSASAPKPAVAQDWVVDRTCAAATVSSNSARSGRVCSLIRVFSAKLCATRKIHPRKLSFGRPIRKCRNSAKKHILHNLFPRAPPSAQSTARIGAAAPGIRRTAPQPRPRFPPRRLRLRRRLGSTRQGHRKPKLRLRQGHK